MFKISFLNVLQLFSIQYLVLEMESLHSKQLANEWLACSIFSIIKYNFYEVDIFCLSTLNNVLVYPFSYFCDNLIWRLLCFMKWELNFFIWKDRRNHSIDRVSTTWLSLHSHGTKVIKFLFISWRALVALIYY